MELIKSKGGVLVTNPTDSKITNVFFSECGNCRNCHGTLRGKKQKHIFEIMRGEEKNSPLPIIDDPLTPLFNYNYLTNLNLCEPLFMYMSINQSKSCVPTC